MPLVYERKAVTDLKEKDLERIKDPERNQGVITALRQWFAAGQPAYDLPRSPAGDVIRKVRLLARNKPAVAVRGRFRIYQARGRSTTQRRGKSSKPLGTSDGLMILMFHVLPVQYD